MIVALCFADAVLNGVAILAVCIVIILTWMLVSEKIRERRRRLQRERTQKKP